MRNTICILGLGLAAHLFCGNAYPQDSNVAKIKALEEMNTFWSHARAPQSEVKTEEYAHLIHDVAELHDPRAVSALAGAVQTGAMAMNGLASLGDAALDPVISIAREKLPTRVVPALLTLKKMLEPENLNHFKDRAMAKVKIRAACESLQNSNNRYVAQDARQCLEAAKR